jgi:hypothetical protein
MRWSARPVVLVGRRFSSDGTRFAEVVACVDGSLISASVVALATSWASALGIDVRVLEVTDPATTPAVSRRSRRPTSSGSPHALNVSMGSTAIPRPSRTCSQRLGSDTGSRHALTRWVMATHGHGLSEQILGSVVLDVVRHAPTPVVVLAAHPHGTERLDSVPDEDERPASVIIGAEQGGEPRAEATADADGVRPYTSSVTVADRAR